MSKEIEDAIDKLKDDDTVGFINDMQGVIGDALNDNEDFKEFGDELEKYKDFEFEDEDPDEDPDKDEDPDEDPDKDKD